MPTPDKTKASGVDDDQPLNANALIPPLATQAMPTVENPLHQAGEAGFRSMIKEEFDANVLSRAIAKMTELANAAEKADAGENAVTQNSAMQRKRLNEQRMSKARKMLEKKSEELLDTIVSISLAVGQEEAMRRFRVTCEVMSIGLDVRLPGLFGITNNASNDNTGEHTAHEDSATQPE